MWNRIPLICVVIISTIFGLALQTATSKQSVKCSDDDLRARLRPDDPAYPFAMELTQSLRGHAYVVKCELQSTMINMFEGQEGAALYRTNQGDFEVLFLSTSQNFTGVIPIERRSKNGGYLYSFRGTPKGFTTMESSRPMLFAKHANEFFITYEEQLAISLDEALNSR